MTRARLSEAALGLALERGVDGATIQAISAAADVSPRTFFTYFDSKDDALLGIPGQVGLDAALDRVGAHGRLSPCELAVRVVIEWVRPDPADPLRDQRRELLRRSPRLRSAGLARLRQTHRSIADAIRQRVSTLDARGVDPGWAEVVVAASVAAVRSALEQWAVDGGSAAGLSTVEERAMTLLTKTWENLA